MNWKKIDNWIKFKLLGIPKQKQDVEKLINLLFQFSIDLCISKVESRIQNKKKVFEKIQETAKKNKKLKTFEILFSQLKREEAVLEELIAVSSDLKKLKSVTGDFVQKQGKV